MCDVWLKVLSHLIMDIVCGPIKNISTCSTIAYGCLVYFVDHEIFKIGSKTVFIKIIIIKFFLKAGCVLNPFLHTMGL